MQSLNTSITRGKPFSSRKEMPRGGGLPLCLSGVCILAQVPLKKQTTLRSTSSRNRSSSSGVSSVTRNFVVRAALDLNAAESRNQACDAEARSCEDSSTVPSGPNVYRPSEANICRLHEENDHRPNEANDHRPNEANDHRPNEANVHQPRFAVAQEMAKLDRRRESLKKRRSVQGLGSFLEEQAFRLSRVPREFIRSWWLEMVYAELYSSNPRLGHCSARAA